MSNQEAPQALQRLLDIMARLRDPQQGCPWDLQQTFQSIAPHTLEEVYEVVDAIETGDMAQLEGELGDLLFQIVFYAQLGREQSLFDFASVAQSISDKLVHRHPHVFAATGQSSHGVARAADSTSIPDADQVAVNWESIKTAERQRKQQGRPVSALDDVPAALPALLRAAKLQKRAANLGFDWHDIGGVQHKLDEELAELKQALDNEDALEIEEEFGDVLFTLVNLSRHLKLNPESCLRNANAKFERRFRMVENLVREAGSTMSELNEAELDVYWRRAKLAANKA